MIEDDDDYDDWPPATFWNSNPWWLNVGRNWRWIFNREWKYYYCNLWCFLTDTKFCKGNGEE